MTDETENLRDRPIGVFDSGLGGLTVVRELRAAMPAEDIVYLGDSARVPYGIKSLETVRRFALEDASFLLARRPKLIVVACNTASAAALHHLRQAFPRVPFVGMEPAVKPAAEQTRSGVVGVLATPATFQGELYASVIERFAKGVEVLQDTCPGLVMEIDGGHLDTRKVRAILERALNPMLARGIDTVVLGCTHFPFVIPTIEEIVGPKVRVIDPSPAIARQVERLLDVNVLQGAEVSAGQRRYLTTGDPEKMGRLLPRLVADSAEVGKLVWEGEVLKEESGL